MGKRRKIAPKAAHGEPKRHQRMVCLLSEEEQRIADATATAAANATKDAPVVTDPATWNERGKALMDRLSSDEFFVEQGIKVDEKEGFPYLIAVNRAASTVTVYTLDEEGRYTVPYMAMVCSAPGSHLDSQGDRVEATRVVTSMLWCRCRVLKVRVGQSASMGRISP